MWLWRSEGCATEKSGCAELSKNVYQKRIIIQKDTLVSHIARCSIEVLTSKKSNVEGRSTRTSCFHKEGKLVDSMEIAKHLYEEEPAAKVGTKQEK